jgi:hypothetical protein
MSEKDKTKWVKKAVIDTAYALPKTLQAQTELMPFAGTTVPMYAVYGKTDDDRRVWAATFLDSDEASAWVQASKAFGRPVKGGVVPKQSEASNEEAAKPN